MPLMLEELLHMTKDYVEGRLTQPRWHAWLVAHAAEVESTCGRFTLLRLKRRGSVGAVSVLQEHGVAFEAAIPVPDVCPRCGEPLFLVLPGRTSAAEMRAFAETHRISGWQSVVREGWMHPGQYCPRDCTTFYWNVRGSVRDD